MKRGDHRAGNAAETAGHISCQPRKGIYDRVQHPRYGGRAAGSRENDTMTIWTKTFAAATLAAALAAGPALAGDADSCKTVKFSDVGWTDITATTAVTSRILEGLGYTPTTTL